MALDGFNLVSKFGEQGSSKHRRPDRLHHGRAQGAGRNDFGAGKLTLKIDNVDGKALKDFSDLQPPNMALLQQGENLDPDVHEQQTSRCYKEPPMLLKGNPSLQQPR